MGLTAGVILVGMLIYLTLTYYGFISIDSIEEVMKRTQLRKLVDMLMEIIQQEDWDQLDSMKKTYELLHRTKGGVKLFLETVFILIQKPEVLNKVALFVAEVENQLHNCQELSHPVYECFRSKLGTSKTALKLFDHLDDPEKLKFKITDFANVGSDKILKNMKVDLSFV